MHIYFSGIGGVGLGPLAEVAKRAGYTVSGSDIGPSLMTKQLDKLGIPYALGQTGAEIAAAHDKQPIDWVVITAALPLDHPEIAFAKSHDIRLSKRDELINYILSQKKLQLIAVSGTHGKTTTTGMLIWLFKQFDIPVSYAIGTTLSFASSGTYNLRAKYFIYEADEYDRNMLKFRPDISLITTVDYDHPDSYPTAKDYTQAFRQFIDQSKHTYISQTDAEHLEVAKSARLTFADSSTLHTTLPITLPGEHYRHNASLAIACFTQLFTEFKLENVITAMNNFPGTMRRFEKLANNLYTTYSHHPREIAADIQLAREISDQVYVIYQPHQNLRQHDIQDNYKDCFDNSEHVYWLPTYLSRENKTLPVLSQAELIAKLDHPSLAEPAELNEQLIQSIRQALKQNKLVVAMGAGDVDDWLRSNLKKILS
ncbi:MAG TPA: Mur ligase domain-containing protein [Patescibacteria group bacterium]|jgi:UDP-N-acetylmuramate--alanine ligase|nr:Mur ligase domain-containing protein [Patescibacteria group bacterium]